MANSTAIDPPPLVRGVVTLQHPDDADFVDLWRLWLSKRGNRPMPSRRDFEPWEFKPLLPDVFLVDVLPPPARYRFRLVGGNVVRFHGHNFTGKTFEECFDPSAAGLLAALYDSVVEGRAPIFRAGAAYWWTEKQYDMYESCHLPLSPDGRSVNMVLAAIRFHKPH
ncbi:MAG TPA: PAS domain-containing protein [Stellaceae bacterium]|nr:PAS domain-containing protein [Stellaceae bacterium]